MSVRTATHAGSWFEGNKTALSRKLDLLFNTVKDEHPEFPIPGARVLVGPHAGHSYCGKILAQTYGVWDTSKVKRVFIMGPSHFIPFRGSALTQFSAFDTPLGRVPVDTECISELMKSGLFEHFPEEADEEEHSIELHLPFLFKASEKSPNGVPAIVPIIVATTSQSYERELGELLAPYIKDEQNAFVISSDFCHWGRRFDYTAYTPTAEFESVQSLSSGSSRFYSSSSHKSSGAVVTEETPVYKSIEYLDRKAMEVLSTGSIEGWNQYHQATKNTICGRKPFSVLLNCLKLAANERIPMNGFASEADRDSWGKLQWIGYAQSNKARDLKDFSVSYSSGYSVL